MLVDRSLNPSDMIYSTGKMSHWHSFKIILISQLKVTHKNLEVPCKVESVYFYIADSCPDKIEALLQDIKSKMTHFNTSIETVLNMMDESIPAMTHFNNSIETVLNKVDESIPSARKQGIYIFGML